MKTLVEILIQIKENLSDKVVWERAWEANKLSTTRVENSLRLELANIFRSKEDPKYYSRAYSCVSKAIIDLFEKDLQELPSKTIAWQAGVSLGNWHYAPTREDMMNVRCFEEFKNHENLMKVLDLAIRYAKIWIFS